jgi:polysaccharide export outer membrane protein
MNRISGCCLTLALLATTTGSIAAQSQPSVAATSAEAGKKAEAAAPSSSATVSADYEIGPGDVVAIHVWKEPELSRTLPVRPDGFLSLPLIGEIKASGFTAAQLQTEFTQQYQKFMSNPTITVMVQEARSRRFSVMGEVQRPGSYILTQPTTVLESLAMVGGFRNFANLKKIYVLRTGSNGSSKRIPFNYSRVIKGKDSQANIFLQPGDTVVVP